MTDINSLVTCHSPPSPRKTAARRRGAAYVRNDSDPAIFEAIRESEVAMALWERRVPQQIADLLRAADLAPIGAVRLVAAPDAVAIEIAQALRRSGMPTSLCPLAIDIGELAERYARIMAVPQVEVRLEHVTGDACRKFHADFVKARLITTYHGQATQWLDRADARRHARGAPPKRIRQLKAGEVALMKGRLWAEEPLLHRSPPIAASGTERLLLVINPPPEDSCGADC